MNQKIRKLQQDLEYVQSTNAQVINDIKDILQDEYEKIFEKDSDIQALINGLENNESCQYQLDQDGLYLVKDIDFNIDEDCQEYLDIYLSNMGYILDINNEVLKAYLGDDFIAIQNDTRHGNGVWQNHKCIIKESEYTTEDGEIDEVLRNKLIEEWMEKEGFFPYVGIVTSYGDFFPVNTKEGGQ